MKPRRAQGEPQRKGCYTLLREVREESHLGRREELTTLDEHVVQTLLPRRVRGHVLGFHSRPDRHEDEPHPSLRDFFDVIQYILLECSLGFLRTPTERPTKRVSLAPM